MVPPPCGILLPLLVVSTWCLGGGSASSPVVPAQDDAWPRTTRLRRRKLQEQTAAYADKQRRLTADDGPPDTPLWKNLSGFAAKDDVSAFWTTLCNKSLAALAKQANESAYKDLRPMEKWQVVAGKQCPESDQMLDKKEFTSEVEAFRNCGPDCSGVSDTGCGRQTFRLCKIGAKQEASSNPSGASCLRMRPPPGSEAGTPRPPTKMEFWKRFCAHPVVKFQELWPQKQCAAAAVTTLTGYVPSEAACADLAVADAGCSKVFDFKDADSPVCRCVKKGASCGPVDGAGTAIYVIDVDSPTAAPGA